MDETQQGLNQAVQLFRDAIDLIARFLQIVWYWSFGQIIDMFDELSRFMDLPLWKQVLSVIVIAALLYLLYALARDVFSAFMQMFYAIVSVIGAIVANLPRVLVAGIIAFAGAWMINNLTISWLP